MCISCFRLLIKTLKRFITSIFNNSDSKEFRHALKQVRKTAKYMIEIATTNECFHYGFNVGKTHEQLMIEAGFAFDEAVLELWKFRDERNDEWPNLLNIIHTCICNILVKDRIYDQHIALYNVTKLLYKSNCGINELNNGIDILEEAEFDVYAPLRMKNI